MQQIPKKYSHEHVKCLSCAKDFLLEDFYDSWKCNFCQKPVAIYAQDHNGKKLILNRLNPAELRPGFNVVVPSLSGFELIHSVIAVTQEGEGFRVALRKYRTVNVSADCIFECVIGHW